MTPDDAVRTEGTRDLVLAGFGPLGIATVRRFATLRDYFLPQWREAVDAAPCGPAEPGARDPLLPAPPAESSQLVVGPAPEPVDADLDYGSSGDAEDSSTPDLPGVAPVSPSPGPPEPELPLDRVAYIVSGRMSGSLSTTAAPAPVPGGSEWNEWVSELWAYTQSAEDERRAAMLVAVVDDEGAAQADFATFVAAWDRRRNAYELILDYASVCLLLHAGDGVPDHRPELSREWTSVELTQRDESRRVATVADVIDQAALAVLGLWAGDGNADFIQTLDGTAAPTLLAVGGAMVCLPFANPNQERALARQMLGRFLDRQAAVCEGFTAAELASDWLMLTPAAISVALMSAPADLANVRGDLRDELRVAHVPPPVWAERRYWADQLRNLRRLQIEATRPRLMRELAANYEAWKSQLLAAADDVADELVTRQVELPVARWALEKLNETVSAVDMHKAGWRASSATGSRDGFDAVTTELEEAVANEPFGLAIAARSLLLAGALWVVLWTVLAITLERFASWPQTPLGIGLAIVVVAASSLAAFGFVRGARRRIVGIYQLALKSLDQWLIRDLEAYAADLVAKGLTGLHAHIEGTIGSIVLLIQTHEALMEALAQEAPESPRSARVLALDEPPLEIIAAIDSPQGRVAPDDLALDFIRTRQRAGWRTLGEERLRGRVLAACRQASGRCESVTLEMALARHDSAAERVLTVLRERCIIQMVPDAAPVGHACALIVADPEHPAWEAHRAALEGEAIAVRSWAPGLPAALFVKTRRSEVPRPRGAAQGNGVSDDA